MGARQLNVASYLASQPLFQGMAAPDLARMALASISKRLLRGDELFRAGQMCEGLYLVVDGLVKLYAKAPNGHEKVIEVIGPGGCVAEALMFNDIGHSVNASVLADSHILVVPKSTLLNEIERNPNLALRMLYGMSQRLSGLMREIEAVTLHSGVQRVVDYLLRSPAATEVASSEHDLTVSLPASKGTIASLLSVTPEHFSRILHELQAHGLIAVDRRHIRILDAQGLASYA
jgi:CRP/FNR family transcriptional regulator, dissimilatory nitrate respiration regulator